MAGQGRDLGSAVLLVLHIIQEDLLWSVQALTCVSFTIVPEPSMRVSMTKEQADLSAPGVHTHTDKLLLQCRQC